MSTNQSERGSFKLKKTNYIKVMRQLRDMFNDYHNYNHTMAVALYEILKENKIKKNRSSARDFLDSIELSHNTKIRSIKNDWGFKPDGDSIYTALNEIFRNDNNTILKPRRSEYPKLTNKEKSINLYHDSLELTISASEKDETIYWDVNEGNHNCDAVDGCALEKAFFKILRTHKWGKNEGGSIRRKVESMSDYEEDDDYNISMFSFLGGFGEDNKSNHYGQFHKGF